MKSLALFLLIIGIVFVIMGYMDIYLKTKVLDKKIEYRYVPRGVYDQIENDINNINIFNDMKQLHPY